MEKKSWKTNVLFFFVWEKDLPSCYLIGFQSKVFQNSGMFNPKMFTQMNIVDLLQRNEKIIRKKYITKRTSFVLIDQRTITERKEKAWFFFENRSISLTNQRMSWGIERKYSSEVFARDFVRWNSARMPGDIRRYFSREIHPNQGDKFPQSLRNVLWWLTFSGRIHNVSFLRCKQIVNCSKWHPIVCRPQQWISHWYRAMKVNRTAKWCRSLDWNNESLIERIHRVGRNCPHECPKCWWWLAIDWYEEDFYSMWTTMEDVRVHVRKESSDGKKLRWEIR